MNCIHELFPYLIQFNISNVLEIYFLESYLFFHFPVQTLGRQCIEFVYRIVQLVSRVL